VFDRHLGYYAQDDVTHKHDPHTVGVNAKQISKYCAMH